MATPLLLSLLLMLLLAALTDAAHECERTCEMGDTRTCYYEFHLQEYHTLSRACYDCPYVPEDCLREECIVADGIKRSLMTINRQLPAPSIQVCEGDRVVVDLHNMLLSDTETLHWHGQHMRGHQYYDGVPFLTQCPIIVGAFRYDYVAGTPGTHWWHSHVGLHRGSGNFGSLIVRQWNDPHRDLYDTDLSEHVIMINDWGHTNLATQFLGRVYSIGDAFPRTILVNGKGRNSAAKNEGSEVVPVPLEVIKVTKGLKHRLRFITSTGFDCPVIMSVDNHQFTIIAMDGSPIIPFTTDYLVMYSGERFDLILHCDQDVDNYWIRFNGLIDCSPMECVQGAILRYDGAIETNPVAPLTYEPTYADGVVVNPLNTNGDALEEVTIAELESFEPSLLDEKVDRQFYLGLDFNQVNNSMFYNPDLYPYQAVNKDLKIDTPQFNGITFLLPNSPPLSQPEAEQKICYYGEDPPCDGDFCMCTYVLEVELGQTVEFVLVDQGTTKDDNHPFHLHGYNFHVVAMGRLGSSTTVAEIQALDAAGGIKRRLKDTVKKDTVTIPDGGYTIIRFTADNPGWWLMHCHLVFHSELGMTAVLHVGTQSDLPPVPQGFPTCGKFMPPIE